jgi:hypothetical protein
MPAGFVAEVSAAVQWAAAELQHETAATPRHTWLRHLGKILVTISSTCFGLQKQLVSEPGYLQMLLPAARLAWMLLEAEQQADSSSSSSGGGSSGARHGEDAAPSSQQQQMQMQPVDGMPGTVLEFLQVYGVALYTGLPDARRPVIKQLCSSEEVLQLLLAYTALSVGAAHKLMAATAPKAASRHSSSSSRSSSSSSKRGRSHSSTAAAAAAAADIPASHLDLLASVSPPLHKQISRQHARNPAAEDYGSFQRGNVKQAHLTARLVLMGFLSVLKLPIELPTTPGVTAAGRKHNSGSSSLSYASSSIHTAASETVIPREQQLLLPLLLTLIEYMQLMPEPQQGVVAPAMQLILAFLKQSGLKSPPQLPGCTEGSSSTAAAAAASTAAPVMNAALADGLTAPVLLQLGPVALQYLRNAAAGATPEAVVHEAIMMGGSVADGGSPDGYIVIGNLAFLVMEILAAGTIETDCELLMYCA